MSEDVKPDPESYRHDTEERRSQLEQATGEAHEHIMQVARKYDLDQLQCVGMLSFIKNAIVNLSGSHYFKPPEGDN